jgi:predicted nucleotidyltransferase
MKKIMRIKFGSHLYGTNTPESDEDFKSIFIPTAEQIILGRGKQTYNTDRPKAEGEKNFAGEVDEESFTIQQFLKLLSEGQTVSLDVLFAPEWAHTQPPSWVWKEIVANRDRLLTRKSSAFIGYARQQANKYGIKGSRVASSRAALELLNYGIETYGAQAKLYEMENEISICMQLHDHMEMTTDKTEHVKDKRMWTVCNRSMPYLASIKNARDIMAKIVDEYGKRALMAEKQEGVDWKALSHAVRISQQALELFQTGKIEFPRHNAEELKMIKTGLYEYKQVAELIENLMEAVEAEAPNSSLPTEVDYEWIDQFVFDVYKHQIVEGF